MTQKTLKTKLGKRLRHLLDTIEQDAEVVWDLCCDHGALGRAVLESRAHTEVIFNDIHPDIMARLSTQLEQLQASNYKLITSPAEHIKLLTNTRQTVVISGIGDEQCIKILSALCRQENATYCQFVVSPTTKVALVRRHMIDMGLYLLHQSTVTENKRTYEAICVSTTSQFGGYKMNEQDDIGTIWKACAEHIQHIEKLIGYYEGQALNNLKPYSKHLLNRYEQTLKKLNQNP